MSKVVLNGMNTDVMPLVDFGTYGGGLSYLYDDIFVAEYANLDAFDPSDEYYDEVVELIEEDYDGRDAFEAQVRDVAAQYIQEALNDYDIPFTVVTGSCEWHFPKFYNYSDSCMQFDLEVDTTWVEQTFADLVQDDSFVAYIKKAFSSRDGFYSFIPSTVEEFDAIISPENADYWKVVAAIISYYVDSNPSIREDASRSMEEYLWSNSDFVSFRDFE